MNVWIHDAAAKGFQIAPDAYERGRPEYPMEAFDHFCKVLKIHAGTSVADIGAGTGKFTKLLISGGARVVAIEPIEGMRKKFASLLPEIETIEGSAEVIPLPSGSLDVVVAAQAFHWFDGSAVREIERVLKPGGRLGLIWNVRDESVDWVARLTEIIDPYEQGAPRYSSGQWKKCFEDQKFLSRLECRSFRHVQLGPPEMILDRVASISFIAALSDKSKSVVLEQVGKLLSTHPALAGKTKIEIPYRTDLFWCSKITS